MAKALKTVALVVGVAALAVATYGASLGPTLAASTTIAGVSIAALGTALGIAGAVASLGAGLLAKKPSSQTSISGNQTQFTSNPDQGLPYAMGRTAAAGWNVHDITYDASSSKDNAYQTFFGAWSVGPIQGLEAFQSNGTTVTFALDVSNPSVPDEAVGGYHGWMFLRSQLGACPEPAALTATGFLPSPPGWSPASKLSGLAAYAWTLKFDTSGATYPGGDVPQPRAIMLGTKVYDPRQDSTFPGGSGPCRAGDESTYVWDGVDPARPAGKNPFLHGLTWALGRFQNGKRVIGIGMTLAALDVPAFANAANVADANNWTVGGVAYSTDGKLAVLQKILAAGSGQPLQLGGVLSCEVDTPRVSLATITDDDIIGDASVVSTPTSSSRINGCIPSYRSEDHDWEIVPAAKVAIADYIAADGKPRTKALTWEFCQDVNQVAQLAAYAIVNAREFTPIVTPLKLKWIGYKPGDALTINSADLGQQNQLVVIQKRQLDPSTAAVTLTMRSETTAKHDFALGKTTTPPPTPTLAVVDRTKLLQPGIDAAWPNIADPDPEHPKPEDGATVGAPVGTLVAGTPAEQVISAVHGAESNITQIQSDVAAAQSQIAVLSGASDDASGDIDAIQAALNSEIARAQGQEGTLHSLVTTAQSSADGANSAVSTETTQRASADTALSARIDSVSATAGGNSGSITSEAATRASADAVLSGRVDTVQAVFRQGTPNQIVNSNFADGFNHWGAGANSGDWLTYTYPGYGSYAQHNPQSGQPNDSYLFQDVPWVPGMPGVLSFDGNGNHDTSNQVLVDWLDGNRNGLGRAITADGSSASWGNRVNGGTATAPNGTAFARVYIYAGNRGSFGQVTQIQWQQGTVPTAWSDVATQTALINSLASVSNTATAAASQAAAVASQTNSVQAQLNGLGVTVSTQQSALATLDGRTRGFWGVSFNGNQPILGAYYIDNNGNVQSGVVIGGNLYVDGNVLVTGSVQTAAHAANSITDGDAFANNNTVNANNSVSATSAGYSASFTDIVELSVNVASAGKLSVTCTFKQNFAHLEPGASPWACELLINGTLVDSGWGANTQDKMILSGSLPVSGPSQPYIQVRVAGNNGMSFLNPRGNWEVRYR